MVELLRGQWKDLSDIFERYSIMYMEGLLIVPVIMFAFFYPLEVMMAVAGVLVVALLAFEIFEWVKHHPRQRHHHRHASSFRYPL
jgi:hypothetical protein